MKNTMNAKSILAVGGEEYQIMRLGALEPDFGVSRLPYSLKILLENLLRHEDGINIRKEHIEALAQWQPVAQTREEIAFSPSRVILQDFTGVPSLVDLAAMRNAMQALGGNPQFINPLVPADLVIDHSVQIDVYGTPDAYQRNAEIEFERNKERYAFLRWGQQSFNNFSVVPPDTGIVHQINLEYLARVIFQREIDGEKWAYPDTLVGTDSHTTMINGLGVLGWGVGGIEAEAAMLGQPITMLIPNVVGFEFSGKLSDGVTATDLVLVVTKMLREKGVVGKFVEFHGDGLSQLSLADRATIANMAPEYGATCGIFPIDQETINYLRLTDRDEAQVTLVEAYAKAQGLWREEGVESALYSDTMQLNLCEIAPGLAGPRRPQDHISLNNVKNVSAKTIDEFHGGQYHKANSVEMNGETFDLEDGDVVISSITSCTNTSNPSVLIAAGLLAKNAVAKGLGSKPWVKTSLAPGSMAVTEYLNHAGLTQALEALGFHLVGYGCATCIGNSGPLADPVGQAIEEKDLVVSAVLSGNRNFEGRIHPLIRMNFLASPPLVVAYALAGTTRFDWENQPLGQDKEGEAVFLKDIWPSQQSIIQAVHDHVQKEMYARVYGKVYEGNDQWRSMEIAKDSLYTWDDTSTYVKNPPYFEGMSLEPTPPGDIDSARVLALLGDMITTDHISPAGSIPVKSPAGQYLIEHGIEPKNFNSYGSRRGNHEVMMRGTFGNVRLRNRLAPGTEGGWTTYFPDAEQMSIYDAAIRYQKANVPLVILAGKEYGAGSSRDWAAKGTMLLGVRAVIAQSYERIHRSNLVGMGILPLQFNEGESAETIGLNGNEKFSIGIPDPGDSSVDVVVENVDGQRQTFSARIRIDSPMEWKYYQHGGILLYVLRQLATQQ